MLKLRKWNEFLGLKERYINDGIERGRKEGIEKGVILTAKNALFKGLSIDDIIDTTGLTKK